MNLKKNLPKIEFVFKKISKLILGTAVFPSIFLSCSLEYYKPQNSEETIPEFIFNDASFSRYEAGKSKIKLQAEKIEQYKSDSSTYAKNAEFDSYDSDGKLETSGSCGLLEAKTNTENYKLFNDIYLNMISQKMEINAQSLAFNKKSEQITSDYDSEVTLKKEGMEVSGTGFSGSGVSKAFAFEYGVAGTIETEEPENGASNETANATAKNNKESENDEKSFEENSQKTLEKSSQKNQNAGKEAK